jgi:outer membrane protein TolC
VKYKTRPQIADLKARQADARKTRLEAIAEVRRLLTEVRALRAMLIPLENRQAETRRQLESLIAR